MLRTNLTKTSAFLAIALGGCRSADLGDARLEHDTRAVITTSLTNPNAPTSHFSFGTTQFNPNDYVYGGTGVIGGATLRGSAGHKAFAGAYGTGGFAASFGPNPNDVITVAASPNNDFSSSNAMTVSAWVDASSASVIQGPGASIVSKWGATSAGSQWWLLAANNAYVFEIVDSANTVHSAQISAAGTAGAWHLVSGTWNGTNLCVYLDGSSVCASIGPHALGASTNVLEIGNRKSGGGPVSPFQGSIDDVQLYNVALSASIIQGMANGTATGGPCVVLDSGSSKSSFSPGLGVQELGRNNEYFGPGSDPNLFYVYTDPTAPGGPVEESGSCVDCVANAPGAPPGWPYLGNPASDKLGFGWYAADTKYYFFAALTDPLCNNNPNVTSLMLGNGMFHDLYLGRIDGSQFWNLTNNPHPSVCETGSWSQWGSNIFAVLFPYISRDGSTVIWSTIYGAPNVDTNGSIGAWAVRKATLTWSGGSPGSGTPSLTNVRDAVDRSVWTGWNESHWISPDGTKILFNSDHNTDPETGANEWLVDVADQSGLVQLNTLHSGCKGLGGTTANDPDNCAYHEQSSFAVTGNWISYTASDPFPTYYWNSATYPNCPSKSLYPNEAAWCPTPGIDLRCYIMRPDGTLKQQVQDGTYCDNDSWHPSGKYLLLGSRSVTFAGDCASE